MSFTGFSSDEEGSIVFDGKKFIVNNPKKVPENFGPGDKPVIGLPEDHSSHPNNRRKPPSQETPPATVRQPQPESTRPSQVVRLGEQILRRNEERAEQDAAAQSPEPSLSGFPQDIEWSPYLDASGLVTAVSAGNVKPDIGQDKVIGFCEALHTASPEGTALMLKVMTGAEPDDEEQSAVEELVKLVRSADFVEHFENEPWYTTRLGPTAEDLDSLTLTTEGTTHSITDDHERWYRVSEGELHPFIQHALTNTFSSEISSRWNEQWTKPEDLEGFLKARLAPLLIKDYIDSLPWDELTNFGMINMYHSLLETLWNEHWNPARALDPWVSSLDDEFTDADDLLSVVAAVPLVNEARLLEEFDYAGVEEARGDLLDQVQYAYEKFDIRPPEDLHEWSALQLANEFYSLLTGVFEPYAEDRSNTEYYQKAYDFVTDPDFVTIVGKAPSTTIDRLDGSQQESPLKLVFFVASFFIEPLDWYLTAQEMVSAAEDEDWWQVVLSGVTGIAPGAFGRLGKLSGKADEVVDVTQLGDRVDDAVTRGDTQIGIRNWQLDNPKPTNTVPNQLQDHSCVAACGVEIFERTTGVRTTEEQMLQYMGYDGSYDIPMRQGFEGLVRASDELAAKTNATFRGTHMDVEKIAEQIAEGNTVVAALGSHAVVVEGVDFQSGIVRLSDPWGKGPDTGKALSGTIPVGRFEELQRTGGAFQVIIGILGNR